MANYYLIDETAATAILNYLVDRPYREVYKFIEILQNLNEAVIPADITIPDDDKPTI